MKMPSTHSATAKRRDAYDAFISYSHSTGKRLAPAIQSSLARFARPWNRLHTMRVFRDETNLAVNPALWSSIRESLESSRFFVLLASPEAAASIWVERELSFWLRHRVWRRAFFPGSRPLIAWAAPRP